MTSLLDLDHWFYAVEAIQAWSARAELYAGGAPDTSESIATAADATEESVASQEFQSRDVFGVKDNVGRSGESQDAFITNATKITMDASDSGNVYP